MLQRKPFLRGMKRRMNWVPMFLSLFLPWGIFVAVFMVTSFSIRYTNPWVFDIVVAVSAIVLLAIIIMAVVKRLRTFSSNPDYEPSWLTFLAASTLVAFVLAYVTADSVYSNYTKRYLDFSNLNSYTGIYPNRMRGAQLMDAGEVQFADGTRLDISRSMGFKKGQIYCVAPITFGNQTLPTYDFWAVGNGCCSGNQADFHCSGWSSPQSGGLRLMDGGSRGFYRLAVQQAEAAYQIRAAHPLFFTWTPNVQEVIEGWQQKAQSSFVLWTFAYLLFQAFVVVVAALAFSRLGYY